MRVVVSAHNVVNLPQGGGHFWVFMQYVAGLRSIGCDVWWLEEFHSTGSVRADLQRVATLQSRLRRYGLAENIVLYSPDHRFVNIGDAAAREVFRDTDLLLNFYQRISPWMLEQFRRTALVDIDPGLLQYWITSGVLKVEPHDLYFTTGETVGRPGSNVADCGIDWIPIRPPVSLDLWTPAPAPVGAAFTTISTWWGTDEYVEDGAGVYDNNKRAAFLRFLELPKRANVPLELALCMDPGTQDDDDLRLLVRNGWRVRQASDVAGTPQDYQRYIRFSSGEFSCAKASCIKFQNAWVSDRTLCYLASGRPVVVEDTGPSTLLKNGFGMFRFRGLDDAAAALAEVAGNYAVHAKAARELAEVFDARRVAQAIVRNAAQSRTMLYR